MRLKTNHKFLIDMILGLVTSGIWNILVTRDDLTEGEVIAKSNFKVKLVTILLFIPFTSGIGALMALIYRLKAIKARGELLEANGFKPQTTSLRFLLSHIFGVLTLGIWPLVEGIFAYKLWNKANEIHNNQQAA